MKKITLILLLVISTISSVIAEDRAAYIQENYTKKEVYIPMRDGKRLFTSIYSPKDTSKKYPILITRTPYSVGPYGEDKYKRRLGPYEAYEKEGFIFVFQDVRGRFMSEGEFKNMRPHLEDKKQNEIDESTDTYDTIDWLLQNLKNHNGRVGLVGISYPGFYCSAGMIDSHPALVAVSPQAPIADWFIDDDVHRHGALTLPLAFNFFYVFGQPRPEPTTQWPQRFDFPTVDGYQFFLELGSLANVNRKYFKKEIDFWNQIVEHPNYDKFWQSRNILPHLKNIKANVLVVGGWFDTEDLYGALHTYDAVENQNPGIYNKLVMGPWFHGGWTRSSGESLGDLDFGAPTSEYYQKNVELPFFLHFLKDSTDPGLPEALIFETGNNRWRQFDSWPPPDVEPMEFFLNRGKRLTESPPGNRKKEFDEFISDPEHPVPYTMEITTRWAKNYMCEDQRFASWRPDVLSFSTEILEQDLTIAGPVKATLYVSTTGSDADWIVKLIDVFPGEIKDDKPDERGHRRGGQHALIRADVMRSRFRNSYHNPEPMKPGKITEIEVSLQDVCHTFKKGHRLMIQIQSTWFPFLDRNPQKFVPNIYLAKDEDFIQAYHRVYHSRKFPSKISLFTIPSE